MSKYNFLHIQMAGYGHWKVKIIIFRKEFTFITTDSSAVDDYRDFDDLRRHRRGYRALKAEALRIYRDRNQTRLAQRWEKEQQRKRQQP